MMKVGSNKVLRIEVSGESGHVKEVLDKDNSSNPAYFTQIHYEDTEAKLNNRTFNSTTSVTIYPEDTTFGTEYSVGVRNYYANISDYEPFTGIIDENLLNKKILGTTAGYSLGDRIGYNASTAIRPWSVYTCSCIVNGNKETMNVNNYSENLTFTAAPSRTLHRMNSTIYGIDLSYYSSLLDNTFGSISSTEAVSTYITRYTYPESDNTIYSILSHRMNYTEFIHEVNSETDVDGDTLGSSTIQYGAKEYTYTLNTYTYVPGTFSFILGYSRDTNVNSTSAYTHFYDGYEVSAEYTLTDIETWSPETDSTYPYYSVYWVDYASDEDGNVTIEDDGAFNSGVLDTYTAVNDVIEFGITYKYPKGNTSSFNSNRVLTYSESSGGITTEYALTLRPHKKMSYYMKNGARISGSTIQPMTKREIYIYGYNANDLVISSSSSE